MEFNDNRSKRIVFISNCILNQNARFPGIEVEKGSFSELIEILIQNGIGIEQLPCLECLGWGGIARKTYYKFQSIVLRFIDKKTFPIIKLFFNIWLYNFIRLCKKEATKVVKRIQDYSNNGYEILGIIALNDSPTCGVTKTIDLLDGAKKLKSLGFKKEDLENPDIKEMRNIVPALCIEGSGLFISSIITKLEKNNMKVKVIGFDPWAKSIKKEAERVSSLLNI
jgi:predicted secreted protein